MNVLRARKKNRRDLFFDAWHFLNDHPMSKGWRGGNEGLYNLYVWVTKVDPKTKTIEDDRSRNTLVQVWLEFGPMEEMGLGAEKDIYEGVPEHQRWQRTHDIRLDCGGNTYEEAIVNLARLVKKHYGEYEEEDV